MISTEDKKILQNAFCALGKKFVQVYVREKNFEEGDRLIYALMAFEDFMANNYNLRYSYLKHKLVEVK